MNCPHCETHIDEHEATLCLDAWIAELVMGWEYLKVGYVGVTEGPNAETLRQRELSHWMDVVSLNQIGEYYIDIENNRWVSLRDTWEWSTGGTVFAPGKEMNDAWNMLGKFEGYFDIERLTNHEANPEYDYFDAGFARSPSGFSKSAPLAMCRAAIKAKGKEA